jgi:hypothetical protein
VPITTPGDTTHETKLAVADIGSAQATGTAGYRTVRPVVWEDGGSNPASYPITSPRVEPDVTGGRVQPGNAGQVCSPGHNSCFRYCLAMLRLRFA